MAQVRMLAKLVTCDIKFIITKYCLFIKKYKKYLYNNGFCRYISKDNFKKYIIIFTKNSCEIQYQQNLIIKIL